MKSVHHYGKFFGFLCADAFLNRAGVRAVRDAFRMKGYLSALYVFAAHEVAIHIIQYLIAVHIAVVVWGGYGLRMVVIQAGAEGTYHKIMRLKGLVYGWRLVYAAGYRLTIAAVAASRVVSSR